MSSYAGIFWNPCPTFMVIAVLIIIILVSLMKLPDGPEEIKVKKPRKVKTE